jgi:hypothetical protein
MSDKTIRLLIDLTYNQDIMHGDDEEAIEWFNDILLGDNLQLGDFGDLGDMIGFVKVVPHAADRIEELESSIRELFALLDITEQTDDGHTFHPNTIRSSRALDAEKLDQVLCKLKKWV